MGKKSADVKGAAKKEGEYSRATARDTNYADRPDQNNPWGNMSWGTEEVIDPATGQKVTKWTQNQTFNPDIEAAMQGQMGRYKTQSDMADNAMARAQGNMMQSPDWAQFGEVQDFDFDPTQMRTEATDAAYARDTMRLDPEYESRGKALELKLRNQGLRAGDAAYDNAMTSFEQSRADDYERARYGSVAQGGAEYDRMFSTAQQENQMSNALRDKRVQEYLGKREFDYNEATRLGQAADTRSLVGGGSE
jgi:hypothetical protein